jgi:predicted transcriptional regulator
MRNLEITIFEDGVSIGSTNSTVEINEDSENDSIFGKEYKNYKDSEKWECIISELRDQINDEINRIAKEGK